VQQLLFFFESCVVTLTALILRLELNNWPMRGILERKVVNLAELYSKII